MNNPPKVLIADKMSPLAEKKFIERGIAVDTITGLSKNELTEIIGNYNGLAVRSSTKVTEKIIDAATNLQVVGRAGVGVDNIDTKHATRAGIAVMNTPTGNSITTAEHALAMMFSLARSIPQANTSTHQGKWEKSKFLGIEIFNKTLGIIGCGNIGSIVANRAIAMKMKALVYDPYLSQEQAEKLGVQRSTLENLLENSDFITLHMPLIAQTKNIIGAAALARMKPSAYLINCARGGLVNESDLLLALNENQIAGVALDVFEVEPANENPLFGHPKVICTPHLGASTHEAQDKLAVQVAEQMSDLLIDGAITNSVNFPPVTAKDRLILQPYIDLMELLGTFLGQQVDGAIKSINVSVKGDTEGLDHPVLDASLAAGILSCLRSEINLISAQDELKNLGINLQRTTGAHPEGYIFTIQVDLVTEFSTFSVEGTLFGKDQPRIVAVEGVEIESDFGKYMLSIKNNDAPGFVGALGMLLASRKVNIATFALGRNRPRGSAQILVQTDSALDQTTLQAIREIPLLDDVKFIDFSNCNHTLLNK